jgi:AraC-like DNA-binding protein/mannose-6-phosphate isomerase-like protein (cupin superfamily)
MNTFEETSVLPQPHLSLLFPKHEEAVAFLGDDSFPIKNILVGITHPFASYRVHRPATNKYYLFEHVLEGEGEIVVNGVRKKIYRGDTYVIDKSDEHDYRSNAEKPLKKIWISFSSEYLEKMLSAYGITTGIYQADVKENFLSLYNVSKTDALLQNVFPILAENLHQIVVSLASFSRRSEDVVTKIKNELVSCIYSKCDLDEIANKLYTSKTNLIRVFKKATSTTPYQFLLNEKIKIAKALLKTTSMTVKTIAESLCFTDEHYFSFQFKQKTGFTPTEYRNKDRI